VEAKLIEARLTVNNKFGEAVQIAALSSPRTARGEKRHYRPAGLIAKPTSLGIVAVHFNLS
jgi:hypothetical protein